jgi:hypothetical protein
MTLETFQPRFGASAPGTGPARRPGQLPRTGRKTPAGQALNPAEGIGEDRTGAKLKALVQLDVEGSQARIAIKGSVDTRNVQAVYVLAKRANSLVSGLDIVLDLKGATVHPEVMGQLRECSRVQQLPRRVDPAQSGCRLRITPAARLVRTPAGLTLAA